MVCPFLPQIIFCKSQMSESPSLRAENFASLINAFRAQAVSGDIYDQIDRAAQVDEDPTEIETDAASQEDDDDSFSDTISEVDTHPDVSVYMRQEYEDCQDDLYRVVPVTRALFFQWWFRQSGSRYRLMMAMQWLIDEAGSELSNSVRTSFGRDLLPPRDACDAPCRQELAQLHTFFEAADAIRQAYNLTILRPLDWSGYGPVTQTMRNEKRARE